MQKIVHFFSKRPNRLFFIPLAVILLDQIIKLVVKMNMSMNESVHVIGDFFKITYTENKGAAFGLTLMDFVSGLSPETAKMILTIFSVLAVGAIVYFLVKSVEYKSCLAEFVALIFGGAVGNIIDRVFYGAIFQKTSEICAGGAVDMKGCYDADHGLFLGRVVDMFHFDLGRWPFPYSDATGWHMGEMEMFPIFNIADAAISIGIVVIILFQKKFFNLPEEAGEKEGEEKHAETENASRESKPGSGEAVNKAGAGVEAKEISKTEEKRGGEETDPEEKKPTEEKPAADAKPEPEEPA